MITDNNKKLAQWAMDYALKNGCQAAKLVLYSNSNASFELRDAKMDRLQQASESGLSISLYVDGRYGSYSTNRLDKKNWRRLSRTVSNLRAIWQWMRHVCCRMLPVIIKVESRTCDCLTSVSKLLIRTTKLPLRVLLPKKSWAKTAALYP